MSVTPTTLHYNTAVNSIGSSSVYAFDNRANNGLTATKISANEIDINGISLADTLAKINDRLAILVPDPKLLAKYAALQEAYDHYKTLERLCQGTD
jgi:hypothetical protein